MKKNLLLLRHAKTIPAENAENDFTRVLLPIGIDDSIAMGQYLKKNNLIPERIYCSTAVRARMTLDNVLKSFGNYDPKNVSYHANIYSGNMKDIVDIITSSSANINSIMIVGHNPELELFSKKLVNSGLTNFSLSPAGLVIVGYDIDSWEKINTEQGKLVLYKSPQMLS